MNFFGRVIKVQERLRISVDRNALRMVLLEEFFKVEQNKLMMKLQKHKHKGTKKMKELINAIRDCSTASRRLILNIYLTDCKRIRSEKFFMWRDKVKSLKLPAD